VHGMDGAEARIRVRAGETVLDAGLREGLALPYECRNGACGLCQCTVVQGRVAHRPYQPSALPETARAQGRALLCCAVPQEDLVIEVEAALQATTTALAVHQGRIDEMEKLAPDVMRLWVALPWGERLEFSAGQYINVLLADGQRRAFSFANPPGRDERIELHVRRIPGGRFTGHVFEAMRVGDALRFEGPLGRFTLREGERPLLFVAGATGFAPVKSILEDAFRRGLQRPLHLYWGVRRPGDLYLQELVQGWAREHPQFHYVPVVSEPQAEDGWTGRTGLVHEALLADFPALAGYEVYVCGSVRMVDSAVRDFLSRGLDEQACFSDAFLPAAQPA
jgi:CDP-4-dehydro-6-deoxyglucose reductase, E3